MRTNGNHHATSPTSPRPVEGISVQEAADLLGTTVDGIRARIKRGTLDSMKVGGQVFVLLGPDQSPPSPDQPGLGEASHDAETLLAAKDETIQHLRRELDARNEEIRRRDHIIMALTERVPELKASRNGQEDAQEPRHGSGGVEEEGKEGNGGPEKRSWWRGWFVG